MKELWMSTESVLILFNGEAAVLQVFFLHHLLTMHSFKATSKTTMKTSTVLGYLGFPKLKICLPNLFTVALHYQFHCALFVIEKS